METLRYTSLAQMFFINCEREDFAGWFHKKGSQWIHFSRIELRDHTHFLALAFRNHGLKAGECLGIVANSSPEWIMADVATQLNHAQVVPLFPNISVDNFIYQCEDSNVQILLVNDLAELDPSLRNLLPRFRMVVCIESSQNMPENVVLWNDLLREGENLAREPGDSARFETLLESIRPDELFSIIYTSGSTGVPKGVELTHRNMILQLQAVKRGYLPLERKTDVALIVLPVAHAFERAVVYYYILNGLTIYFADSPKSVAEAIKEVRPTIMSVVPRILERVYESMTAASERMFGLKKVVFEHALEYAKKREPGKEKSFIFRTYDKVVYSKLRDAIGGRLRLLISGGGALDKSVCRFLLNIGIQTCEGYGLTECSPVVSVNKLNQSRPGSVGIPLGHLDVRIGDQNEILVKGDSVFKGYRNRPDLNANLFTEDGFFRTGDQGRFDEDGYLYLTGRLKELFKTSTGKYVSPNPIEMKLGRHPLVEQALVIANDRKYVSALIFLNRVNAKRFLQYHEEKFDVDRALRSHRINVAIERLVQRTNKSLNHWEQIRKWTLIGDELTIESGLLTPTLKIRRTVAEARYAEEIEKMYQG